MPGGLRAVLHLFLMYLLQYGAAIPVEQALELLYLNLLSTNTHRLQREAMQNPSHFLMSAARRIPDSPERAGEAGATRP